MNLDRMVKSRFGWVAGGCLLLIIGNVIFYILGVANLDRMTRDLRQRSDSNKKLLQETEAQAATLSGSTGRIGKGRAFIDQLANGTLKTRQERLVSMTDELNKLMKSAGVTSDQVGYNYIFIPSKGEKNRWARTYIKTTIQLTLAGSYPQVKTFMREMQNSPHFFIIDSLAVSQSGQGTVVLRASLEASTFFVAAETDHGA